MYHLFPVIYVTSIITAALMCVGGPLPLLGSFISIKDHVHDINDDDHDDGGTN